MQLSKKNIFGPKLGLNCALRTHQSVIQNSHIACNRTILCTFWMPSFNFWIFIVLDFTRKKELLLLFQNPIAATFRRGEVWAITPVNKVRLITGSAHSCKNAIWSFFKNQDFYKDRTYTKFESLVQLRLQFTKSVKMKTLSALIFKENYYYFLLHLIFFSGTDERGVQPLIMG